MLPDQPRALGQVDRRAATNGNDRVCFGVFQPSGSVADRGEGRLARFFHKPFDDHTAVCARFERRGDRREIGDRSLDDHADAARAEVSQAAREFCDDAITEGDVDRQIDAEVGDSLELEHPAMITSRERKGK